MAYGKIKADTLVYDNSGSDVEVTLSSLGNKANLASPTFTGTVTIPTPAANDNTTKAASTAYVQTELGDYLTTALGAPKASPTFTGTATFANIQVDGTTTTVNSSTMTVADKNIEIAKGAANDAAADGAGITIDSGDGDKTWNWVDATDAWTSSEHIVTATGKRILIGTTTEGQSDADDLTIATSGRTGITIRSSTSEYGNIFFSDGTSGADEYRGAIQYYHSNNSLILKSNAVDALTIDSSQNASFAGSVTDDKGNVRSIPRNAKTSAYTLLATDAGKLVDSTSGGWTVPNSVMSQSDAVTLLNNSAGDLTITQGSGVTIYNSADGSTGNRTLATRGMATLYFMNASVAYISGAGLS